jgi:hypothetical protein
MEMLSRTLDVDGSKVSCRVAGTPGRGHFKIEICSVAAL